MAISTDAGDIITGFKTGTAVGHDVFDVFVTLASNNNTAVNLESYGSAANSVTADHYATLVNATLSSATGYKAATSVIFELDTTTLGTIATLDAATFKAAYGASSSSHKLEVANDNQGKMLFIAYDGTGADANAAVFHVDFTGDQGGKFIGGNDTVTLVGVFNGVGANSFDAGNLL